MSLFSKNLRFLRKKANYNQDEISLLFNKRANTIGNWENQKSEPSLGELMKLGEYFNVSIQDLLFVDLEKQTMAQAIETGPENNPAAVKPYSRQEPAGSLAQESGQDAFWLMLREIRLLNEKVDLLVSGLESTNAKKNSDKSYH